MTVNQLHNVDVIRQSFFIDLKLMVAWWDAMAAALPDPDAGVRGVASHERGLSATAMPRGRLKRASAAAPSFPFPPLDTQLPRECCDAEFGRAVQDSHQNQHEGGEAAHVFEQALRKEGALRTTRSI